MSGNATLAPLLNPFTPMAFLPPDLAYQTTISTYMFVGSLAVVTWDILNNVTADRHILVQHRICVPSTVYFMSRLSSWLWVLLITIFSTAPLGICARWERGVDSLYIMANAANSLLFLFRVCSFFHGNRAVVCGFVFLWISVVGCVCTTALGIVGANIGSTKYCITSKIEHYVDVALISPIINDTLIFLAISWKLMMNTHREPSTLREGFRMMIFGNYLRPFSKALLQDQQVYYLTTVNTNLLALTMLYVPSIPAVYRTMFPIPNLVVTNIMACRVYRNTKLGSLEPAAPPSSVVTPLTFQRGTRSEPQSQV